MNHPSVFPAKAGIHAPPPLSAPHVPAATQPIPKITQIKRITVQDKAPPPLPSFRPPHPSFRRKPESTHPRRCPPPTSRRQPNQSQKSPKSNESQFKTRRPHPFRHSDPLTRDSGESRNPRTPAAVRPPRPGGNPTNPKNHPNQTNHSSRQGRPYPSRHSGSRPGCRAATRSLGPGGFVTPDVFFDGGAGHTVSPIRSIGRSSSFLNLTHDLPMSNRFPLAS